MELRKRSSATAAGKARNGPPLRLRAMCSREVTIASATAPLAITSRVSVSTLSVSSNRQASNVAYRLLVASSPSCSTSSFVTVPVPVPLPAPIWDVQPSPAANPQAIQTHAELEPIEIVPAEIENETEWRVIQSKPGRAAGEEEKANVRVEVLPAGHLSVVRRYEPYQYTGTLARGIRKTTRLFRVSARIARFQRAQRLETAPTWALSLEHKTWR